MIIHSCESSGDQAKESQSCSSAWSCHLPGRKGTQLTKHRTPSYQLLSESCQISAPCPIVGGQDQSVWEQQQGLAWPRLPGWRKSREKGGESIHADLLGYGIVSCN